MSRKVLCAFALVFLCTTGIPAQTPAQQPGGYLDVMIVKVKPERRADFDAIAKKIVDANRRNKGDIWIASEVSYGEGNTIYFTTPRASLGDIEQGMGKFMSAMNKDYGQAGVAKLFQDFNSCLVSSRSEIRRRRPDLSVNLPGDMSALEKMVAESRWLRTIRIELRPGHLTEFEAQMKTNGEALRKADPQGVIAVSQAVAGTPGTVFYVTSYRTSLGGFDGAVSLMQALGPAEYEKYSKTMADTVAGSETIITRFVPELSNPPESFLTASPDFWTPKPTALARTKTTKK
jgi:quinol monooxygenase YgiN